jgi:hypothetical protein
MHEEINSKNSFSPEELISIHKETNHLLDDRFFNAEDQSFSYKAFTDDFNKLINAISNDERNASLKVPDGFWEQFRAWTDRSLHTRVYSESGEEKIGNVGAEQFFSRIGFYLTQPHNHDAYADSGFTKLAPADFWDNSSVETQQHSLKYDWYEMMFSYWKPLERKWRADFDSAKETAYKDVVQSHRKRVA